jgi:surfeit locus 1 family protein
MQLPPAGLDGSIRLEEIPADSLAWRRLRLRGTWDFEHEVVIRGRASRGTPGVHVVTPLRLSRGWGVLVLRGWLPAADGLSADLAGARPARGDREGVVEVEGLALADEAPLRIPPRTLTFGSAEHLVLGALTIAQASGSLPYDLLPVFVLLSEPSGLAGAPSLVDEPTPSDGPHLWYAVQWFAFALITLGGTMAYVRTRSRSTSSEGRA